MSWKVIDKLQNNKVIESHTNHFAAFRAMMILTAHEVMNGRKAHYAVDPEMVQAATPTLDELKLPDWAYNAIMNASDDVKLAEIKKVFEAEVALADEINAELAAEEAGDLVAKQVQEGKVILGPDGEVRHLDPIAKQVYLRKYARSSDDWEKTLRRIVGEAESRTAVATAAGEHLREKREESAQGPAALDELEKRIRGE